MVNEKASSVNRGFISGLLRTKVTMRLKVFLIMLNLVSLLFITPALTYKVDVQAGEDPGKCGSSNHGTFKLVKDREDNEKLLVCSKDNGVYIWKTTDGSRRSGEFFNPSHYCSDILDKDPKAKDGLYWVDFETATPKKVWCDMTTDGGGYMLLAKKSDPEIFAVPSNSKTVTPNGSPHWSSEFGDVDILDFRIQVATTENFKDTIAHWSFRFQKRRPLKNLLVENEGGCDTRHAGIGHISYVKDLLANRTVTHSFRCSIFGYAHSKSLRQGWSTMNICLTKPCRGFGFDPVNGGRNSDTGQFSYSATNSDSGMHKESTASIGCDRGRCCACYGPVGGTGNYCDTNCQKKHEGKVTKKNVFTWIWVRPSLPKKIWSKCMEYQAKSASGEMTWYKIVGSTAIPKEGRCADQQGLRLNDGVVVAQNSDTFKNIPAVPGLLSYRRDNKKIYVRANKTWTALSQEKNYQGLKESVKTLNETLYSLIDSSVSIILLGKPELSNRLRKWLPSHSSWHLCYRASRDGWKASTFHSHCDGLSNTVTIVRVGKYIFGGYIYPTWSSYGNYKSSSSSFIFSLKNKYNLEPFKATIKESSYAIYDSSSYGPTFGGGHDLFIADNAFWSKSSYSSFGHSYRLPSGYNYGNSNTQALLAGSYSFTPSEIEVFVLQ